MALAPLIAGILLLLLGRKIFWIYVGGVGFVIGFNAAKSYFPSGPDTLILGIAVGLGIVGIVIALFFQKVAIASSGFLAGAYITYELCLRLELLPPAQSWLALLAGGVIGILLALWLFEWAMVFLSSLLGAILITEMMHGTEQTKLIVTLGLAFFGVLIQAGLFKKTGSSSAKK